MIHCPLCNAEIDVDEEELDASRDREQAAVDQAPENRRRDQQVDDRWTPLQRRHEDQRHNQDRDGDDRPAGSAELEVCRDQLCHQGHRTDQQCLQLPGPQERRNRIKLPEHEVGE